MSREPHALETPNLPAPAVRDGAADRSDPPGGERSRSFLRRCTPPPIGGAGGRSDSSGEQHSGGFIRCCTPTSTELLRAFWVLLCGELLYQPGLLGCRYDQLSGSSHLFYQLHLFLQRLLDRECGNFGECGPSQRRVQSQL